MDPRALLLPEEASMSPKENLLRLIDQLPDDRLEELERVVISMLESRSEPAPGQHRTFEEAKEWVFQNFDKTFRRLADS
jgi:hypothetical protein